MLHPLHLTPALATGSVWEGAPLFVPMVWGILECLGEPKEAGSAHGSGMEKRRHTRTCQTTGWEGLGGCGQGLGVSWGPRQPAGLG